MADDAQKEQDAPEEAEEAKGGNPLFFIIVVVLVLLIAGVAGFLVFRMFLAPKLVVEEDTGEVDGGAMQLDIPENPQPMTLDTHFVNVMRDAGEPASTLVFQVTIECANLETFALVDMHKSRFEDMITKLHDSRTRDELDDVLQLKNSIQRQAVQKSNDLIKRLQLGEPNPEIRITAVFHNTLAVQE